MQSIQEPKKTIKAYKLFRVKKGQPGKLFPLFIGANTPTPMHRWISAEFIPTKGFAERPGWHVGRLPIANHLMRKDGSMPPDRVWAEVEIPADVDWQEEANKQPTKDIKGKVPSGGYYRFKRPAHQGGEWLIAGAIKVNKVLDQKEVDRIISSKMNESFAHPKSDRELEIEDYEKITSDQYAAISRMMRARGYDIHGAADAKFLIARQAGLAAINNNPKLADEYGGRSLQAAVEVGKTHRRVILYDDWAEVVGLALGATKPKPPTYSTKSTSPILKRVVKKFGLTHDPASAGFIMPNGTLLDLSGGGVGVRGDDHRIVLQFMPGKDDQLKDFVALGPIRMIYTRDTLFDIRKKPTNEQFRKLREIIGLKHGDVYIDVWSSMGKDAREYKQGVLPDRVIADIEYFYKNHELPPISKAAVFHVDESALCEATKSEVLDTKLIDKFRNDYLLLMRNLSRIKNYSSLVEFMKALKRYEGSLEMTFGGRSVDRHVFSTEQSPLRTAMFQMGLKPKEIDVVVDYWQDELYKFLYALTSERAWDRDVWHGSEDQAIRSFNNTRAKWRAKADRAARTFWNRMHSALDLFSDMAGKKIDIPQDETIEVDGRNVILFGYNDEKHRDNLNAKITGLKRALAIAKSKLPRLFPKNLQIVFKFTPDIKTAGEYHHYFDSGSRAISVSFLANTPEEAMKTIIHEAAHHYYYTVLDERIIQQWRQVFLANFKDSYLDLNKLASIWDRHENMGITSLVDKVLVKEDPVLAKQLDYVILHSRNQNSPFWTRDDLQKIIDSGEKIPAPKMLASGYSGKNTGEMFAETVAAYLSRGSGAVPDYLIGLLRKTFESELKEQYASRTGSEGGYHCSSKPIDQHDDMAGVMALLDTEYGSEWYGRILQAIGDDEALELQDEEPSDITSKQGRAWSEKALDLILKRDMRMLFVSDEPDHDYGDYCYSVDFPKGAKVTAFTDYNHPSGTAYVFHASVKPIFKKIDKIDESVNQDFQRAAMKSIGHLASTTHKGKGVKIVGEFEIGNGKMIIHGDNVLTPGEAEFKRVREGWKGLLFTVGKSYYFVLEKDPNRAWLFVPWGSVGDAFNPKPMGLRATLQSIYDAHGVKPDFSANMNTPLPIVYIPPESVPFIKGASSPGGEWLKPSTSLKDVVVIDGRSVILGKEQAGAAIRGKKALRAVDIGSLRESAMAQAVRMAISEIRSS